MLKQLSINNVALIDRQLIEFFNGFSVMTGETGAGKSIIIEALNFVLGERASRELVKSGEQKASVEALFVLRSDDPVYEVLSEQGIDCEEGELTIYREFTLAGKNVCRANGTMISAGVLKEIGDALVDIHGQHAHQSLLNPKKHIVLLDRFAGKDALEQKARVAEAYQKANEARRQLNAAQFNEQERARRCDLLEYQINEIDGAKLEIGEEERLEEQRGLLQNAQAVMEGLEGAGTALSGDGSESSGALDALSVCLRLLDGISRFRGEYAQLAEKLHALYYDLEDAAYTLRDYRNDFSFEPGMLDEIESRLDLISSLKRKYGKDIAEILTFREKSAKELELISTAEERREQLQQEYDTAKRAYDALAEELSELRKQAAIRLRDRILPELNDLGMPHAAFEAAFERLNGELPGANGIDGVEFLLSTNRGEPVKPLAKVASGGELSRIMLSFKSVLADLDGIPTMVFDEIDSGISGQMGTAVAVKMRQIASNRQVLCITHLPQIAAYANWQYIVYKEESGEKTRSNARLLGETERAAEIARVMSGNASDPVALEHASRLIEAANASVRRNG
ncbi:DNA repair protein RecN [bioreactor metagenome]|uniref:DNA repair protein RecN n=1 Tax=bioreactor metagenome TaxID=1076179 RepID=A0A644WXU9_9ZZZZ